MSVSLESLGAYYARRAREEREAAEKATSSIARQSHLDLAQRYQEIAELEDETLRFMESWQERRGKPPGDE